MTWSEASWRRVERPGGGFESAPLARRPCALLNGSALMLGTFGEYASELRPATFLWSAAQRAWVQTDAWKERASSGAHGATLLLASGAVACIGGEMARDGEATATMQVFDPSTRTWHLARSMRAARTRFAATTLADGRVLVASGELESTAETYDPRADRWQDAADLPEPLLDPRAFPLGDDALVVGAAASEPDARAFVLHARSGKWRRACPPPDVSDVFVAAGPERVFAIGEAILAYDVETDRWTHVGAPLEPARAVAAARLVDGRIVISGGFVEIDGGSKYRILSRAEIWDPATSLSATLPAMTHPRSHHHALALTNGDALVTGGKPYREDDDPDDELFETSAEVRER